MKIIAWILVYFLGPSAPNWVDAALEGKEPEPYSLTQDMASFRRARRDMVQLKRVPKWEPGSMRWVR